MRGEAEPEMDGERSTESLAVILAGIKSAREGRRVEVKEILYMKCLLIFLGLVRFHGRRAGLSRSAARSRSPCSSPPARRPTSPRACWPKACRKALGQRVLVVNRPGAGGAIGYRHVAAQKPDGYALVWNSNSISTTFHSGQLDFDYQAFDAVARVLVESVVVAVRSDARWKNLGDLVAEAKAKPKAISVGHSGIGSHTHISLAALFSAAGVQVNEVPYGAAQVVPNLLGGHVDAVVQLPGCARRRRSSRVRCACSPR